MTALEEKRAILRRVQFRVVESQLGFGFAGKGSLGVGRFLLVVGPIKACSLTLHPDA